MCPQCADKGELDPHEGHLRPAGLSQINANPNAVASTPLGKVMAAQRRRSMMRNCSEHIALRELVHGLPMVDEQAEEVEQSW